MPESENMRIFRAVVEAAKERRAAKRARILATKPPSSWVGDDNKWLHDIGSPVAKAAEASRLFKGWCKEKKWTAIPKKEKLGGGLVANWIDVEGTRCVLKFASRSRTDEKCLFSQFYPDMFDLGIMFGIAPGCSRLWAAPHDIVIANTKLQPGTNTGAKQARFSLGEPDIWVLPYGGNLDQGFEIIEAYIKARR